KTLATGYGVRDAQVAQGLLKDAGLLVATIQHGKITPFGLALETGGRQANGNRLRLGLVVIHGGNLYGLARPEVRPELFAKQVGIMAYHLIGGRQNGL